MYSPVSPASQPLSFLPLTRTCHQFIHPPLTHLSTNSCIHPPARVALAHPSAYPSPSPAFIYVITSLPIHPFLTKSLLCTRLLYVRRAKPGHVSGPCSVTRWRQDQKDRALGRPPRAGCPPGTTCWEAPCPPPSVVPSPLLGQLLGRHPCRGGVSPPPDSGDSSLPAEHSPMPARPAVDGPLTNPVTPWLPPWAPAWAGDLLLADAFAHPDATLAFRLQ